MSALDAQQRQRLRQLHESFVLIEADGGLVVDLSVEKQNLGAGVPSPAGNHSDQGTTHAVPVPFRLHCNPLEVGNGASEADYRVCNRSTRVTPSVGQNLVFSGGLHPLVIPASARIAI